MFLWHNIVILLVILFFSGLHRTLYSSSWYFFSIDMWPWGNPKIFLLQIKVYFILQHLDKASDYILNKQLAICPDCGTMIMAIIVVVISWCHDSVCVCVFSVRTWWTVILPLRCMQTLTSQSMLITSAWRKVCF